MTPIMMTFRCSKTVRETKQLNIMVSSWSEPYHSTCCDSLQVTVLIDPGSLICVTPSAREAAVQKIETIIREQFSLEMKNKEHEIDVISQVSEWLEKYLLLFSLYYNVLVCISDEDIQMVTYILSCMLTV